MAGRNESMRDHWHRQPTWVRWTVGLIAFAVIWGLLQWWQESQAGYGRTWILIAVAAVLVLVGFGQAGRRLGGRGQLRLRRRSLKAGRVLEGADRERWRVEIPRQARYLREYRFVAYVVLALEVVVVLAMIIGPIVAGEPVLAVTLGLPFAVLVGLFAVLVLVWLPRKRRQLEVLERELVEEEASDGPGPVA